MTNQVIETGVDCILVQDISTIALETDGPLASKVVAWMRCDSTQKINVSVIMPNPEANALRVEIGKRIGHGYGYIDVAEVIRQMAEGASAMPTEVGDECITEELAVA